MSGNAISPETLAALLDGTLPPGERERVLAIIAKSPQEYEAFADAAAVVREVGVVPWRRRRPWRVIVPAAVAAALVIVALPAILRRPAADALGMLATLRLSQGRGAGSLERVLGATWHDVGWDVMRGSASELGARASAVRIGVRLADVEAAAASGDTLALAPVRDELVRLLSALDGGAPVAERYTRLSEPLPDDAARRGLASAARALVSHTAWLDLGLWLEAARLSAVAGRSEFFTAAATRSLEDIRGRLPAPPGDADAVAVLARLDAMISGLRAATTPVPSAAGLSSVIAASAR